MESEGGGGWGWVRCYSLALMTVAYITGELAHFLINTTGRAIARELHFGDMACFPPPHTAADDLGAAQANCSVSLDSVTCLDQGCVWDYSGLGTQYQVLAGPAFVAVFSVSAVLLAVLSDRLSERISRTLVLGLGTLVFSSALLGMGLASSYWHLVVCRMLIAAGESVCRPMCGSLLADLFPPESRGVANGIFSWGVYWGYGLAFLLGINGTQADLFGYGWRSMYLLGALPGLLCSVLILTTLREPAREPPSTPAGDERRTGYGKQLLHSFFTPALLLLLVAAMARHTAGLSWAYNTRPFFQFYHPSFNIGYWILMASIFGGSFGVFGGGYLSDRLVSRLGLPSRLWLLSLATLLACPLAAATLTLTPPAAMGALCTYYLFAETWFAVLFTVIVEVVPAEVRASAIALFLFFMNQVGGNLPVIITPLKKALGDDYRAALGIMWPGCMALASVLFLAASLPLACKSPQRERTEGDSGGASSPLLVNPDLTPPNHPSPTL